VHYFGRCEHPDGSCKQYTQSFFENNNGKRRRKRRASSVTTHRGRTLATKFCRYRKAGFYQIPGECSIYLSCGGGIGTTMKCAEKTTFNPRTKTCSPYTYVQCLRDNEECKSPGRQRTLKQRCLYVNIMTLKCFSNVHSNVSVGSTFF